MERQTRDGKLVATGKTRSTYTIQTLTTTHFTTGESVPLNKKNAEGKLRRSEFTCPKAIVEFNKHMGGVDRHDHLRSNYSLQRSCTRWWTYFAWFAVDLALINAFLLYKQVHPKAKHKKFHLKVAEQLIGGFSDRKRVSRQFDTDEVFLDTTGHEQDIMQGRARAYRLCLQLGKRTPSGRPKETNHGCVDCKVNLHRDCFAAYYDNRKRKFFTLDDYTQTLEVFLTPTKGRQTRTMIGTSMQYADGEKVKTVRDAKPSAKPSRDQSVQRTRRSSKTDKKAKKIN